jgi:soluble lytic murein transglycosylase-like protein
MKTPLVILAFIICSAHPLAAQTDPTYRVDNFDFANSIHIDSPVAPAKSARPGRRLTTARNFNYAPAEGSLVHPTSLLMNPTLAGFTTGDTAVDNYIVESGKRNSVDPLLLYSIMHQESSFKARAMSYKGARGLMQLMPYTAARFGVSNIWDPRQNIEGGARYMRFLLDLFSGDVSLALAGYNAGEGAVLKYGYQVPPYSETREYVRRIGRRYSMIRDPAALANASRLSGQQAAAIKQREPVPLSIYERSVFMARLPDGRLQLVSQ